MVGDPEAVLEILASGAMGCELAAGGRGRWDWARGQDRSGDHGGRSGQFVGGGSAALRAGADRKRELEV